ncbi:putative ENHANCER OF AG-4 protein 2 [Cocos nucifera]|uniref:Putative ENHANCER OF AG-4 protein 2 n=1 Tax=Cocos nucifera TaxID=13894 RepID=A0A8K0IJQ8_COCNU|nr:putative ENHANCER OF AG-4 protein 2 [Cocos nucifera]
MAPGRRKGGARGKANDQLKLGDLVLAKVKGFPAWPAKISNPKDWGHTPDPKKYFVQFFGTSEIAFVAPADIQVFTNESKSKVIARCQRKTIKCFARAVDEICVAFEELRKKSSGELGEDAEGTSTGPASSQTDCFEDSKHLADNHETSSLKNQEEKLEQKVDKNDSSSDELHGLERCSWSHERTAMSDLKPSDLSGTGSLVFSKLRRKKASNNDMHEPLETKASVSNSASSTPSMKEDNPTNPHPDVNQGDGMEICSKTEMVKALPKSSVASGYQDLGDSEKCHGDLSCNEPLGSPSLATSVHSKNSRNVQKVLENGHIIAKVAPKPKRELNNAPKVKRSPALKKQEKDSYTKGNKQHIDENIASCDGVRSKKASKLDIDVNSVKRSRRGLSKEEDEGTTKGHVSGGSLSSDGSGEKRSELHSKRHKLDDAEDSRPAKKSKYADKSGAITKSSTNSDLSQFSAKIREDKVLESKKSTTSLKADDHLVSKTGAHNDRIPIQGNEAILPLSKRHCRELEAVSNSEAKSARHKTQFHPRRRSCRIDDEDEEEGHRTPVHKQSAINLTTVKPDISTPIQSQPGRGKDLVSSVNNGMIENPGFTREEKSLNDRISPVKVENDFSSPCPGKIVERGAEKPSGLLVSPGKPEYHKSSSNEVRKTIISPKTSVGPGETTKLSEHKSIKPQSKTSCLSSVSVKKAQSSLSKLSNQTPESSTRSHNLATTEKNRSSSKSEMLKVSSKSNVQMSVDAENRDAINFSAEHNTEKDVVAGERSETAKQDKPATLSTDSKFTDSFKSMKHLIAAAQAKRRQAQSHCLPRENAFPGSVSTPPVIQGRSPSPASSIPLSLGNSVQKDAKGTSAPSDSPSVLARQLSSTNQVELEEYEHKFSPGHRPPGGSLSGDTEAAVARDALEGMLETLSRTKDSIGRATRLAIDCAKYGIAGEIVELLIRKLEGEPSFHRRIDLFFLVDSITQCSHNQKGIAGASYVPTVQAALPRLLGAAAPPGASARENRRQCLKVLRLWLERKILPEPLLRQYMDDIDVPNDDTNDGFFLRRPSRAERSVDDPIREMEGMLVDEYGSNATFQLPGLLSSHVFEDEEEDLSSSPCKDTGNELPVEAVGASEELDTCAFTPSDRHHHILEDVDGELEMEDVSTLSKDEKSVLRNDHLELESQRHKSDIAFQPALADQTEGNQLAQMTGNAALQGQEDVALKSEVVLQQPANFMTSGVCNAQPITNFGSSRPYEYGHNDMYLTTQSSHSAQQFQQGSVPFHQRPYHPLPPAQTTPNHPFPPAQTPPNHFSHVNPMSQQNMLQPYNPYTFSSHPNSRRHFASDEQRRVHSSDFSPDNHHNAWVSGGRSSTTSFMQDGILRTNMERASSSSVGFQLPLNAHMPSGASVPGCFDLQVGHLANSFFYCHHIGIDLLSYEFIQAMVFPRCYHAGPMFLLLIVGGQLSSEFVSVYVVLDSMMWKLGTCNTDICGGGPFLLIEY